MGRHSALIRLSNFERRRASLILCFRIEYPEHMSQRVIASSPDVLGGTAVFVGTRVPVQTFIEYIKGGESIDDFLDGFPAVSREQVLLFLDQAKDQMIKLVA